MRFSPPPPPTASPPPDIGLEESINNSSTQNTSAEDLVPPECPKFAAFLLSLDPYTFWLLTVLIALFIAKEAGDPDEQEAIGNFLESIGTNIEYIAEQGAYLQVLQDRRQQKIDDLEKQQLKQELADMKKTMAEMKEILVACCPNANETLRSINQEYPTKSDIQSNTYESPPK